MKKKNSIKNIINIAGFYTCWWLSIYGASQESYFLGPISLLIYMIIHFIFLTENKVEYRYILICSILAFLFDTFLLNLNLIEYRGFLSENYQIAPLWVACLWISFSLSIFHSFKILQKKYKQSMFLGVLSGPFIYYSLSKIGIITLLYSSVSILILISISWMFIIPFYVFLADKLIDCNAE